MTPLLIKKISNKIDKVLKEVKEIKEHAYEGHPKDLPAKIHVRSIKPSEISWAPHELVINSEGLEITLSNEVLLMLKGSINTIK